VFEIILAEQESKIIGIAFYYMAYSTWKGKMLFLEDFVVKEELRGQGIGKLIFRAYLEEARRQNVSIAKWQVLDWNEPAINFYEKYNSTIEKQWFNGKILKKDFDEIIGLM
jgi:GNAT superfamily N-acetyltransferase